MRETYQHPSRLSAEQRRENTARMLDRFAAAHDKVRREGLDPRPGAERTQRQAAASARRAADRIRSGR